MKKKFVCFLLCCAFFLQTLSAVTSYKQVVLNLLNQPNRVLQFFAEINTSTYDLQGNLKNTYKQNILWIRNEFLFTEIFNEQNQLIYLIYNNQNTKNKFVKNLSFSELDVGNVFVGFFSKTQAQLLQFYESLGINYFYTFVVEEDNNYYYRLGKDSSYSLLNKENYRTEKLVRPIYFNGKELQFTVIFQDWHSQKEKIPQTIKYYLDGKLFKQDDIVYLQFKGLKEKKQNIIKIYE